MTTIAFKDGIMAADSLVAGGDVRRGFTQKLFRWGNGGRAILGLAGEMGWQGPIIHWLDAGWNPLDPPKLPPDIIIHGIVVLQDGRVGVFSKRFVLQFTAAPFHAQGSGNEIAIGAMEWGATAAQAVETATKHDVFTGGPVQTLKVHE